MEIIRCKMAKIYYTKPGTDFRLITCLDDEGKQFTAKGSFPIAAAGMRVLIEGAWEEHPQFGIQFKCKNYEEVKEEDNSQKGLEAYLSEGPVPGIGPKLAKAIIREFGERTREVLENEPELLSTVKGIGKRKAKDLARAWRQHFKDRETMIFFSGIGLTPRMTGKLIARYGEEAVSKVKENPYRLIDDIDGIGFVRADEIAISLGIERDSRERISAGLCYSLKKAEEEGSMFLYKNELIGSASDILGLGAGKRLMIEGELNALCASEKLIRDKDRIYQPVLYRAEVSIAYSLGAVFGAPLTYGDGMLKGFRARQDYFGPSSEIKYSMEQENAIRKALDNKALVITGGPGTGKTTVVKGIVKAMESNGCRVVLAAPTGKAAKRMEESTGHLAKTIHRLLEFQPTGGFGRNAYNPLDGDVLIVDECSMIDSRLMAFLLEAVPPRMKVIFVGDVDQLPSIGAGCVLRDLIDSSAVPVARLTEIFRQGQMSAIVMGAHCINSGRLPDLSNRCRDLFFDPQAREDVPSEVVSLVCERLQKFTGRKGCEIQVLTPMRKNICGCEELNKRLQDRLNPSCGCDVKFGSISFRKGDRVMQIKNNYKKKVFNGDTGFVTGVFPQTGELSVKFGSTTVEYKNYELEQLDLAYATTIHKSQGSEYPVVVIPITSEHTVMMQRNLLYTALTRAKEMCVLVGDSKTMEFAVRHNPSLKRNTALAERIRFAVGGKTVSNRGATRRKSQRAVECARAC